MAMAKKNIPVSPPHTPPIFCHICNLQEPPLQAFLLFPNVTQWTNNISHCMSIMFPMGGTVPTSCQLYCEHTKDLSRQQGKAQYTEFCCYWLTLLRRMSGGRSSFCLLQEECWKGRRISIRSRALLLWNSKFAHFTSNWRSSLKTQCVWQLRVTQLSPQKSQLHGNSMLSCP